MPQTKAREMQETPRDAQARERESFVLKKIRRLSADQLTQLAVIIDEMVGAREKTNEAFLNALTQMSDESFRRIWGNPRDAEYDNL